MTQPSGLRRDLGTLESYASMVGILVGAGIFKVTGNASALTGSSVVLGYLLLAPVVLAAAIPYAVFQSTSLAREPGGDYGHIRAVFGCGVVAFLTGWLKLISYLGALAFLAAVLADYSRETLRLVGFAVAEESWELWRLPAASAGLVFFWFVHSAGVRWFGRVQVVMFLLLGVALATLVVPGVFAVELKNYRPVFPGGASGFFESLPLLFFAYAGFEALSHTAGEVRDAPQRLPRIYLRGVLATTAIFVAMSAVAFGVLDAETLAQSSAPMADAAAQFLPGGAAVVVTLGGVMAAATSVNVTMAVPARLAITMADDGLLPAGLARLHPGSGTPRVGLTVSLLIALALLWSGQVAFALGIAVLALLLVYCLHSVALLLLARCAPAVWAEVGVQMPWTFQRAAGWLAVAALGAMIATIVVADCWSVVEAVDRAIEQGGLDTTGAMLERLATLELTSIELLLVWSAVGVVVWFSVRRRAARRGSG